MSYFRVRFSYLSPPSVPRGHSPSPGRGSQGSTPPLGHLWRRLGRARITGSPARRGGVARPRLRRDGLSPRTKGVRYLTGATGGAPAWAVLAVLEPPHQGRDLDQRRDLGRVLAVPEPFAVEPDSVKACGRRGLRVGVGEVADVDCLLRSHGQPLDRATEDLGVRLLDALGPRGEDPSEVVEDPDPVEDPADRCLARGVRDHPEGAALGPQRVEATTRIGVEPDGPLGLVDRRDELAGQAVVELLARGARERPTPEVDETGLPALGMGADV